MGGRVDEWCMREVGGNKQILTLTRVGKEAQGMLKNENDGMFILLLRFGKDYADHAVKRLNTEK